MATQPTLFLPPIDVFHDRSTSVTFDLYAADGTPAAFESADTFRYKVWSADGASPDIDASESGSESRVEVLDLGTAGVTPARVRCHFHEAQTDDLTVGTEYNFELLVWDDSASKNVTICKGPLVVNGTAAGNVGA